MSSDAYSQAKVEGGGWWVMRVMVEGEGWGLEVRVMVRVKVW